MVALVRPPKTLQEAYDVYGKDFVEGPGVIGIGRIADQYNQSGNLIQELGLSPFVGGAESMREPEPMPMMPVYNRQPYSNIYGIVNTNASQAYLEFLRSLGIEI